MANPVWKEECIGNVDNALAAVERTKYAIMQHSTKKIIIINVEITEHD